MCPWTVYFTWSVILRMILQYSTCTHTCTCFRSELMIIVKGALIRGLNIGFYSFSLPVILFVTFWIYASVGGTLTPKRVFTTLSLLSLVRLISVHFIVQATLLLSEGIVAIQRIQVLYYTRIQCCSFI